MNNKCNYIIEKCPDYCYGDKCNLNNTCYNNICKCNKIKRKNENNRYCVQKNITILSKYKDQYTIPYDKNINNDKYVYYNKIYNKVYNSQLSRLIPYNNTKLISKQELNIAKYIAKRKTIDWIHRYSNSQGTTNDGWPAIPIIGTGF